jgi:DNA-directed RNA polymerase specialized sigma24 family protein
MSTAVPRLRQNTAEIPSILQDLIIKEQMDLFLLEVSRLPMQQHNIVIAALNGVGVAEYAKLMNKNFDTVKSSYNHACHSLRKAMTAYEE